MFYMDLWLPPGKRVHQSNGLIIISSVEMLLIQIACRAFLTNIKVHRVNVSNQLLYFSLLLLLALPFILGGVFSPLKQMQDKQ